MSERYYITTPIFYPNGSPHIGHAYNVVATDAMARFHRADGKDVFFLSGTDEHGLKMQQTAEREGLTPQRLADRNTVVFQRMLRVFNISNDDFIRTTENRHLKSCQAMWRRLEKAGDIYLGHYAGWYSVQQETYYDEKDTKVSADGVRREKEIGSPVKWNEEESYFFRLSRYQESLLSYYEENPSFIGPNERYNEIVSFVRSGLRDLSISRTTFKWGIPVPGHPGHIMYVWIDALTNYLTALGFPDSDDKRTRQLFWPADVHIIGKDIIRFHAIYWPAFLMSAGMRLPKRVFAHGFLLNHGKKMSKSIGNVVDPFRMVEHFGLDQIRYFLLREVPFGQDGSYSEAAIVNRINADLANNLGNLAQRLLLMIATNLGSKVPVPGAFSSQDELLLLESVNALQSLRQSMKKQAPHLALTAVFHVIGNANRYFSAEKPWILRKIDGTRFATVLYTLLDLLSIPPEKRMLQHLISEPLKSGSVLPLPRPIFPRHPPRVGYHVD